MKQHVIVSLIRMLEAFVFSPLGVAGYLQASITSPLFTLKNTTYLVQTLLGDAFMVPPSPPPPFFSPFV